MKYDFDEMINRCGTDCAKWDEAPEGVIPAWVADMDFRTAPAVIEALQRRVGHGIFGYSFPGEDYYEALTRWFSTRHGWTIDPSTVIYTTGVVPAISAIMKGLLAPGDGVIVQTPAYNCFFSSIRNNGLRLVNAPLVYRPDGYTIDFEEFERLASQPWVKMLLLCNPHNPVGRVWTREELTRLGNICLRHDVFVLADEIHCELTYEGHDYTPYQSLGEAYALRSVACVSPSKAFNIAGLHIANIVCPDPMVKARVDRGINDNEVCDVGPFGIEALKAAYNQGGEWLDQLRAYLWQNYLTVKEFFEENLPDYPVLPLQGTYLVWFKCSKSGLDSDALKEKLITDGKVWLCPGSMYGEGGRDFMRLNIACPRERLMEILRRIQSTLP